MLYKKELGITSIEAKITLKTIHVIIGYVFTINLLVRFILIFKGDNSNRYSAFIPGKGYFSNLKSYLSSIKEGKPQQFIGHNPIGKLAVTFMFFLLLLISVSGLIRAGTDIYFPPFGSVVSQYVVQDGVDASSLKPYDYSGVDKEKMASLKAFKGPIGRLHIYAAFLLMFLIFIHVFKVIHSEVKDNSGLISSMFSGKKYLTQIPQDKETR